MELSFVSELHVHHQRCQWAVTEQSKIQSQIDIHISFVKEVTTCLLYRSKQAWFFWSVHMDKIEHVLTQQSIVKALNFIYSTER